MGNLCLKILGPAREAGTDDHDSSGCLLRLDRPVDLPNDLHPHRIIG